MPISKKDFVRDLVGDYHFTKVKALNEIDTLIGTLERLKVRVQKDKASSSFSIQGNEWKLQHSLSKLDLLRDKLELLEVSYIKEENSNE